MKLKQEHKMEGNPEIKSVRDNFIKNYSMSSMKRDPGDSSGCYCQSHTCRGRYLNPDNGINANSFIELY